MTIEGGNDEPLATVKKALISPLRDRWTVKVGDGPDLAVKGNVLDSAIVNSKILGAETLDTSFRSSSIDGH
jgi:uncharacterized protein YxjI